MTRVTGVGTCPLCSCWLQSTDTPPTAQPHYDACHPGTIAPRHILG